MGTFKARLTYLSGTWSQASGNGSTLAPSSSGQTNYHFTGDQLYLDADIVGVTFASLPPGFTVSACVLHYIGRFRQNPGASLHTEFGVASSDQPNDNSNGSAAFSPKPDISAFSTVDVFTAMLTFDGVTTTNGMSVDSDGTPPSGPPALGDPSGTPPGDIYISGTYVIEAWWYSESLDDWQYGEDPGGDYVEEPDGHPYPYVSSITPNSGPTAGGTSVTIVGGGFLGPDGLPGVLNVMFDGEYPATSVVVNDQHELTCVTPAHWYGTYNVVVNLDF